MWVHSDFEHIHKTSGIKPKPYVQSGSALFVTIYQTGNHEMTKCVSANPMLADEQVLQE